VVAAGATFVIPALYINRLDAHWWQIFLACAIGGILGTVLIIALRKYFVKELHGELPFPEATAINEVLVTGESSAGGAGKILLLAFAMGAAFDFLVEAVHLWNANLTTDVLPWGIGESLAGLRIEIQIAGIAALFGLGLIIGIKYASIIASGSVLAVLVLVPLVYMFGAKTGSFSFSGKEFDIGQMNSKDIFDNFIKPIGIGAIAISGLIGIIRMGKIVASSVTLGFKGLSKKGQSEAETERTQLDMKPANALLIQLGAALAMGVLFFIVAFTTEVAGESYGLGDSLLFAVVGMVVGFLLSFLFTPVAAQAIAIVGVNPVSGMTLITVVLAIGALILVGLKGSAGMIIALIVGTAVCTALSTSGALISDFKIGYWIGSTPRNQQRWKFLGVVVAALVVAFVIPLMDQAYHFLDPVTGLSNDKVLPAPQANMIGAMAKGLMADPATQPWLLYALGGVVAFLLMMAGVPMLAFALGMYLPIFINMAVLSGAICAWAISKTGKTEEEKKARADQVTLVAAGLMAGAAIVGLLTAVLRLTSIGAPIQYISAGVDYEVEAVVDGKAVWRDGKYVEWCDDIELQPEQTCSERLAKRKYEFDENGQPLVKGGQKVMRHAWYEKSIGRGLGALLLLMLCFGCYFIARLGAKWQRKTGPPS
jgi:putative OPT family oligopeptide transporter